VNNVLKQGLDMGLPITTLMESWDFLQVRVHRFAFNCSAPK
jgi:hypothetical protein